MNTTPSPSGSPGAPAAEARLVELDPSRLSSLEAVERRRLELWIVTAVVIAATAFAMLFTSWSADFVQIDGLPAGVMHLAIVGLALGFCAYAIEKELHLRKITRRLLEEQLLTANLSNRLTELSSLLQAGRAMNSVLDLEEVLDIILTSSIELLGGESGSIMLVEGADELTAVAVRGNPHAVGRRVSFGEGIAGRTAAAREPLLISGEATSGQFPGMPDRVSKVTSAMSVPLVSRVELLGVLNVSAPNERAFSEHDLRALSIFAEQAASAIANARLYRLEQENVAQLVEVDQMKSEFVASVNHDLRTPLTLLLGGAALARRPGITSEERNTFLEAIERQARHLASMIDALLTSADLERSDRTRLLEPVDISLLSEQVSGDFRNLGRDVSLEGPEACRILGNERSLRRVLLNLIDNGFKHGAPPLRVVIEEKGDGVHLSVIDSGPGIPPEHRERIFDRFFRLDPNRSVPGMGLGLGIVRSLVASCGGTISVEEGPEGGTRMRVVLRQVSDDLFIDSPPASAPAVNGAEEASDRASSA